MVCVADTLLTVLPLTKEADAPPTIATSVLQYSCELPVTSHPNRQLIGDDVTGLEPINLMLVPPVKDVLPTVHVPVQPR